jgi:hypothetical protein
MLKLFFQDVSLERKELLAALDRYDDLMYELDPNDDWHGDFQHDVGMQARRDAAFEELEQKVREIFERLEGEESASERTVVLLARVNNTRRARRFLRARFDSDYEPRRWFKRVLLAVSWPFYTVKKLLS